MNKETSGFLILHPSDSSLFFSPFPRICDFIEGAFYGVVLIFGTFAGEDVQMVGFSDGENDELSWAVFGFAGDDESASDGAVDSQRLGIDFLDVLEALAEVF